MIFEEYVKIPQAAGVCNISDYYIMTKFMYCRYASNDIIAHLLAQI